LTRTTALRRKEKTADKKLTSIAAASAREPSRAS
jgi:hypothetical protein